MHGHTVIPSMYAKVLSLEYSVMKHDIMFQCLMPSGRVVATFTWPKNYSLHAYYVVKKLRSYIASTLKTSQQNVIQLTGSKSNHVFKPQDGLGAAGLYGHKCCIIGYIMLTCLMGVWFLAQQCI